MAENSLPVKPHDDTIDVGELRRILEGLPDDAPVGVGNPDRLEALRIVAVEVTRFVYPPGYTEVNLYVSGGA